MSHPELTSPYPTASQEILTFLKDINLHPAPELISLLTLAIPDSTYGPGYILASGKLLRSITRPLSDPRRFELFPQLTAHQFFSTEADETKSLGLISTASAKIFIDLIAQVLSPRTLPTYPDFPYFSSTRYLNCSNAEPLFATRIDDKSDPGEAITIFYQDDTPVIIQKSGLFQSYSYENVTNATALTLKSVRVNGVTLPPGTLVGLETSLNQGIDAQSPQPYYLDRRDQIFPLSVIQGLMPLRLTMYAIDRSEWPDTFGSEYTQQLLATYPHYPILSDFIAYSSSILTQK